MFTNTKEVEPYDLTYEYSSTNNKKKTKKNNTQIHDLSQQVDECIPYEKISTNMKKNNDEQQFIVDYIIYKNEYPSKPLHIFSI
jgi:hypothetical protein